MATLKEKIGYALGDAAAGGITWKIMSIAFPFFFTNIFGLTFADAATLMLIARLFDVVTDPIMGSLADRMQSKWGTYRPFLIFGALPFGLVFALLLQTPDFGPTGKRIYAYTLYLCMMAIYTMVNVPYGSLLGVMTDDDNEKNQFSSFRMVGAYAMGFITLFSVPYLQKFIGGTPQHQYSMVGIILGIIAAVLTLLCGLLTKERLKPKRAEKYSSKQFVDLVKNVPWLYLTGISICTNFFNGFRYAAVSYMFTYCLGGDVTIGPLIVNYTVFMTFGEFVCMIFGGVSPWFTKKMGTKKKAFLVAASICFVFSVLFFFIPMERSVFWVIIMIIDVILTSVGIGIYSPLLWSMYSDVADYATEKNGTSSTGLIFSSGTMAQKLGTAISGALVALFMGVAGANMTNTVTLDAGNTNTSNLKVASANEVSTYGFSIESTANSFKQDGQFDFAANSTNTFNSEVGNILKVDFLCNAADTAVNGPGNFSLTNDSKGKYTFAGTTGTWNTLKDETSSFKLSTNANQVSANKIVFNMQNSVVDPQSITPSVLNMIWLLFSIFPAVIAALMILLLIKYPIKK